MTINNLNIGDDIETSCQIILYNFKKWLSESTQSTSQKFKYATA